MFFKKKPLFENLTFKERVGRFWSWFGENAGRFHEAIDQGQGAALTDEVSMRVEEWFPGFGWVFGSGGSEGLHSFTMTGEGCPHRRLLAKEWRRRAPEIDGWCFYPSRQRSKDVGEHSITIGGRGFKPIEFWVTPTIDEEHERVNLIAWNPVFESMEEADRYQVLFLWLDEVLGESGTEDWLGSIELHGDALADAFPVTELAGFVDAVVAESGWVSREPGEDFHLYRMPADLAGFPRADIVAGSSSHMRLISDHIESKGRMDDPLLNLGASFVFVAFDSGFLSPGKEVDERGLLEDALDEALLREGSGRCLGGALGSNSAYIDLVIYDRHRSWKLVLDLLKVRGVPRGVAIHPFADDSKRVLASL